MKKLIVSILWFLIHLSNVDGQIIDDSFYSDALEETKAIDIYLPPGYYDNPTFYYPVVYLLHGWNGSESSIGYIIDMADSLMNYNLMEPAIVVAANNNSDPFKGSFYTNSSLNGEYETYSIVDVISYVESNYRVYPHKNYRSLMGQSMGGYGCFRLGILHKELFRGIAAHGSPLNFDFVINDAINEITTENDPGPPYTYDYYETGIFTKMIFAMAAAFTPNASTPQTYVFPQLIEFPVDNQGMLIDSIYQKWKPFDPVSFANTLMPSDSLAILFGDGSNDNLHLYPGNVAFKDTLDSLGIVNEFFIHSGDHSMPVSFRARGLKFLDSILPPPGEIYCPDPADFQISDISHNSAKFSWSENWNTNEWKLYIGISGFDTTGLTPTEIDTLSYSVLNLLPNTSYEVYLQSSCWIGGESDWVGPFDFKTKCQPMTGAIFEDFDSEPTLPDCWFTLTTDTVSDVNVIDSLSSSGSNSIVIFNDTISSGFCGLSSPGFADLGSTTVEFSFSARTYLKPSELLIGTLEDPDAISTWECIDTLSLSNQFQNYRLKIDSATAGDNQYIALRHTLDSAYIFVDDINLTLSDKKVSGTFNYYNNQRTPLSGLSLTLMQNNIPLETTITDENGFYEFADIPAGDYKIEVSCTILPGGINSLDAGKVNLWWTNTSGIERVRWNAGDVNGTGNINSTDAFSIQQHFVYGTEFERGEWTFWKKDDFSSLNGPTSTNVFTVNSDNVNQDFYGLSVGDFKCDFIPDGLLKVFTPQVKLVYDESIYVARGMEFKLPIKVNSSLDVAALSLIFEVPGDLVEVEDVWLGEGEFEQGKLDFLFSENQLRIGWNSHNSIHFERGSTLIKLILKTTELFGAENEIQIGLKPDQLNQIANKEFETFNDVTLATNPVSFSPLGIDESKPTKNLTLECYPNPFNEFTHINYSIPANGNVELGIYNLNGVLIKTFFNEFKTRGNYSLKYDSSVLDSGVYNIILNFTSRGKNISRSIKIINRNF